MAAVIPRASEEANPGVNWQRLTALAAIVVGIPLMYWPAAQSLAVVWLDTARTTYTHGFAILAVSCWLLWRKREEFSEPVPRGDKRFAAVWILLLALGVLAWQLSYRAGVQIGMEFLLLCLIWLAIGALLGTRAAVIAFLPVAYMGFALTLWDALNPLVLEATVHAVRLILQLFQVPAFFEGDIVHIPAGEFEIQGGCSGLHFLIVALAVAVLMGELRGDGWRRRAQWLLLATAMALVVNWIRVASIIYAGHLTHMQSYVVRESHYGYGWVLFSLGLVVLFLVERRVPLAPTPLRRVSPLQPDPVQGSPTVWGLAVALLAMPLLLNAVIDRRLDGLPETSGVMPRGAWSGVPPNSNLWVPRQLNADHEARDAFRLGTASVERYVSVYRDQRGAKKFGGYASQPQGDAEILERSDVTMGGRSFAELTLASEAQQSMLWVTYEVADRAFDDSARAQLWYSVITLRSLRSPGARVIALWSACDPDCNAARRAVHQFVEDGGIP